MVPRALHVASIVAFALSATAASAAPVVGQPFFLARAAGQIPDFSIASSSRGFLLAWSVYTDTWAQRYAPSAALVGVPFPLARGGNDGSGGSVVTSLVTVASNGVDFAAQWTRENQINASGYSWNDFGGAIIRSSGPPEPSSVFGRTGSPKFFLEGAIAAAPPGWAMVDTTLAVAPSGSASETALLARVGADGKTTSTVTLISNTLASDTYAHFGVASGGATALVTRAPWNAGTLSFMFVPASGPPRVLSDPNLPAHVESLHVVTNGSGYLVAWHDTGNMMALRISNDGAVLDAPFVVATSGGTIFSPGLVDVAAAGETYLLVYAVSSGDGGVALRGARVAADGAVLDSGGFEITSDVTARLTGAGSDLWLLASLGSLDAPPILHGRFIGAVSVPPPPDNVEPPMPDAGAGSDAAVDSGGVTSGHDAAVDASGPRRDGGDAQGAVPPQSPQPSKPDAGAARTDAATGDLSESHGISPGSNCTCSLGVRGPGPSGFGLAALCALGAVAYPRRPRRTTRATICT
jgi:hypothetical protein